MKQQQTDVDTLIEKARLSGIEEEQGYEAPFSAFSWEQWQEMQAQMMQRFSRFQRAIHYKQPNAAVQIAQEVITMGMEWLDEAILCIDPRPRV